MKNTINNKSGFTLLEIIIVIIIVGVLASLALPKFFSTVEFSRSSEALSTIGTLRSAMERCYLLKDPATYAISAGSPACDQNNLDISNPSRGAAPLNPSALFTYAVTPQSNVGYIITATRAGGGAAGSIIVTQSAAGITRSGAGSFTGIR